MFSVPGLSLSGRRFGTSSLSLLLPVPPEMRGSMERASSFLIIAPPIPCGPNSPLCPVKATADAFSLSISIFINGEA